MKTFFKCFLCFCIVAFSQLLTAQDLSFNVDKSVSIELDEKALDVLLKKTLMTHTDNDAFSVRVHYIHDNTAAIHNEDAFVFAPPSPTKALVSAIDQRRHHNAVMSYRYRYITEVMNAIKLGKADASQTQILEALPRLLHSKQYTQIFFISDMLESSSLRDFKHTKLTRDADAVALAKKDLLQLRQLYDFPKAFAPNVSVTVLLPISKQTKHPVYRFIKPYWDTIFSELQLSTTPNYIKL